MKKLSILLIALLTIGAISAQDVKTSMVKFGKYQYSGYLVNLKDASVELVDATIRDIFENQYNMKGTKENSFRAYLNQPFAPFGSENFDIYYMVSEFGKKNDKTTQVSMIVTKGNMNVITPANNPDADQAIRYFLKNMPTNVKKYAIQPEINALKDQLAKLESTKNSLQSEIDNAQAQIKKLQETISADKQKVEETDAAIFKVKEQLKTLEQSY